MRVHGGRRRGQRYQRIGVSLAPQVVALIQGLARELQLSESAVARQLVDRGLAVYLAEREAAQRVFPRHEHVS